MKYVALALVAALGCGACNADPVIVPAKVRADAIDALAVIHQLPVGYKEIGRSSDGRLRLRWTIEQAEHSKIEAIGNDPRDADEIAWQCSRYDKAGNAVRQTPDTFCGQFFIKAISPLVTNANLIVAYLLDPLHRPAAGSLVALRYGDLSIETDGEFYFIRRASRM